MNTIIDITKKIYYLLNTHQKILGCVVLVLTLICSCLECLGVTVVIPVINVILTPDQLMQLDIIQKNSILSKLTYRQMVIAILISVIIIYLIKNVVFAFTSWVRVKFSTKIQREISVKLMESYMSRGYQYFLSTEFGDFNRSISQDTIKICDTLMAGFKIISDSITILLICIFMLITDWMLSLTLVVVCLFTLLVIFMFFRKKMYEEGKRSRENTSGEYQAMYQAFSGIKDVLVLRKQEYFVNKYEKSTIIVQSAKCRVVVGQECPAYIIEAGCVSAIFGILGVRLLSGTNSTEFIGVLAAFAIGAFRILPSLGRLSISINQITASIPSVSAIYNDFKSSEEYVATHPEAVFNKNQSMGLIDRGIRNKKKDIKSIESKVRFADKLEVRNINFRYEGAENDVLNGVSLDIECGKSIAFIGSSGAGKSTLVDVILGLLVPQQGNIYIDGVDIRKDPEKWSRTIGYVPQSVFLSADSIRQNIAFGVEEEDIDDNRVWKALEKANLDNFVNSLPERENTLVGDQGVRLSGGQRQRIAIARALYRDPEILVLDEATSALDNDTEAIVMQAIEELQGRLTLIIVAHRLTTVKKCDVIYEISNGKAIMRDKSQVISDI